MSRVYIKHYELKKGDIIVTKINNKVITGEVAYDVTEEEMTPTTLKIPFVWSTQGLFKLEIHSFYSEVIQRDKIQPIRLLKTVKKKPYTPIASASGKFAGMIKKTNKLSDG
jgi:hypothetical protein